MTMYVALAAVVVSAVGLSRSLCLCSRENSFSDLNTVSDTQDIEDSDGSSSRTSSIFRISSYLPERYCISIFNLSLSPI